MAGEMSSWQNNNEEEEMAGYGENDAEMTYEDYLTMVDNEDDKEDYNDVGDINYKNYLLNGEDLENLSTPSYGKIKIVKPPRNPFFKIPQVFITVTKQNRWRKLKDDSKLFQYKVNTVMSSGMGTTNYIEDNILGYSYLVIVKLLPSSFYESHYTPNAPENLQDETGRWHEGIKKSQRVQEIGELVPVMKTEELLETCEGYTSKAQEELDLIYQGEEQNIHEITTIKAKFATKDSHQAVDVSSNYVYEVVSSMKRFEILTCLVSPFQEDDNCVRVVVIPHLSKGIEIFPGEKFASVKIVRNEDMPRILIRNETMLRVIRSFWMKKRTKRFEFVSKKFYDQSFQVIFKHTERDEMEKKRIGENKIKQLQQEDEDRKALEKKIEREKEENEERYRKVQEAKEEINARKRKLEEECYNLNQRRRKILKLGEKIPNQTNKVNYEIKSDPSVPGISSQNKEESDSTNQKKENSAKDRTYTYKIGKMMIHPYFKIPQVHIQTSGLHKFNDDIVAIKYIMHPENVVGFEPQFNSEGTTKYFYNHMCKTNKQMHFAVKIIPDGFHQETFDPHNPGNFQSVDGSAHKIELLLHMSRSLGIFNVLKEQDLTESEANLVNYKEKHSELRIIYQGEDQEMNGLTILKAKFASKDDIKTIVEVSNDSVFQVNSNDDRFKVLTYLVSPFSEDNNFIRIVAISYYEKGFTIKTGEPIGTAKEIENQDILKHEGRVIMINSLFMSLWTDGKPPAFLDRNFFEDTLNELDQIRQELYELEEKIAEMKNQIHLMNVEEAQRLLEAKQKRKADRQKMMDEAKRIADVRKARNLQQMDEAKRIADVRKARNLQQKLADERRHKENLEKMKMKEKRELEVKNSNSRRSHERHDADYRDKHHERQGGHKGRYNDRHKDYKDRHHHRDYTSSDIIESRERLYDSDRHDYRDGHRNKSYDGKRSRSSSESLSSIPDYYQRSKSPLPPSVSGHSSQQSRNPDYNQSINYTNNSYSNQEINKQSNNRSSHQPINISSVPMKIPSPPPPPLINNIRNGDHEKQSNEEVMIVDSFDIKEEFDSVNHITNVETRKKFIEELIKKSEQELESLEERELILTRRQRNLLLKM